MHTGWAYFSTTPDNELIRGLLFIRLVFWVLNVASKVSGACESSVKLRVGIEEHPDTGRQWNLTVAEMVINLDISLVMDFVMFDVRFFGRYIARWVVFWMLYGPMGRFRTLYRPMGRLLDVVWYELHIAKIVTSSAYPIKPPQHLRRFDAFPHYNPFPPIQNLPHTLGKNRRNSELRLLAQVD